MADRSIPWTRRMQNFAVQLMSVVLTGGQIQLMQTRPQSLADCVKTTERIIKLLTATYAIILVSFTLNIIVIAVECRCTGI